MSMGDKYNDPSRIDETRHYLEKMNIQVLGTRKMDMKNSYIDTHYMGSSLGSTTIQNVRQSTEVVEWDLCMNCTQVEQMLSDAENVEYYSKRCNELELTQMQLSIQLQNYQSKLGQLRAVMDEHPEINAQMTEILVLLKLAGLNDDVLKLIT